MYYWSPLPQSVAEQPPVYPPRRITFTKDDYYGGSLYSTDQTSSSPNALRVYGNWSLTDPESGNDIAYKWMGVLRFNEDGKVFDFADWFDVSSIPSQIEGTYKR